MFFVYILASQRNGTLYIGRTDDLGFRLEQHRTGSLKGFTWKYGIYRLVYYEVHPSRETAFVRERQMKKWRRAWKLELIERFNPAWNDLTDDIWI
jgi:putative endonuclease